MLNVNIEKDINEKDKQMIEAFKNTITIYQDNNVDILWDEIKECKFQYYNIGKGGNHIWITRKEDNKRIAIII